MTYDEVERVRKKYGKVWWPTYREDGEYGTTPDGLTETNALDAVLEALNQEGVEAWSGDATGIVAQMLHQQYKKRKEAERRVEELERRLRKVDRATYGAFPESTEHDT